MNTQKPGSLSGFSNSRPQSRQMSAASDFARALQEAGGNTSSNTPSIPTETLSSIAQSGGWPVGGPQEPGNNASNSADAFSPWNMPGFNNPGINNPGMGQWNPSEFAKQQEQLMKEQKMRERRLIRHREVQQMDVYNARQIETERKIDQIIKELGALAKDLSRADEEAKAAQNAVITGIVEPGEYHVTFLEKLLKIIVLLRKRVKESTTWLQMFQSRSKKKRGYWGQYYKKGTQWSQSADRSIATSVG